MDDGKTTQNSRPGPPPAIKTVTPPDRWRRVSRWLGPVAALALIALAATVLREITREITWTEVRMAVRAVPLPQIAASIAFAALAMVTMALYDILSCRLAGIHRVPARIAGLAGFSGYALANALGFHVLLGGSVRYRIYATQGLSAQEIAQILTLSLGTIWLAVGTMFSVVFLVEPMAVPVFGRTPLLTQLLGAGIGIALIALIVWLWPGRSGLRLFGWTFPVPDGKGAIAQIVLGVADFGLAAAALYVLVPPDLRPDFLPFALIFMTAFIAGSLSHAPGGLGVFEAGILLGLAAGHRPDAIAALIVFRLTYYILPFLVAVLALGLMEATRGVQNWRWAARPILITLGLGLLAAVIFFVVDWLR
jgi:phosphatidylglycerol lysyltransferase